MVKLKKAILLMVDGPDPRFIPHLYCTVLGAVIGPIDLRRLSMQTGGVEFLKTLFEMQTKMSTIYDLYLWRHWLWLFENEFEVEGYTILYSSHQKRISGADLVICCLL